MNQSHGKTPIVGPFIAIVCLLSAGAIQAHHALAPLFDTDTPVTITGTIVEFARINPHSYLYIEQQTPDGPVSWAVESPAPRMLVRRSLDQVALEPGDTVEACGYVLNKAGAPGPRGRVLVAEVIETADGAAHLWSDYGNRHCREQNAYEFATD
jgi:hypothetical protein